MTFIWIIGIICAFSLGVIVGCMLNAPLIEETGELDFTVLSRQDSRTPW